MMEDFWRGPRSRTGLWRNATTAGALLAITAAACGGDDGDAADAGADAGDDPSDAGDPSDIDAAPPAGDPAVVLFGGVGDPGEPSPHFGTTWLWDGERWSGWQEGDGPILAPDERESHAMTYAPGAGHVLLFAGEDELELLGDTWTWDGGAWRDEEPDPAPPPRRDHDLAYDRESGEALLFGGLDGSDVLGDTWEWDGEAFTLVDEGDPAGDDAPSPRSGHALAPDPDGGVLLFGGFDDEGVVLGDTWRWDGEDWNPIELDSEDAPPARFSAALALDEGRDRTVLFGGNAGGGELLGDTWEWDGEAFTLVDEDAGPAPRHVHDLAYDRENEGVLLFGGEQSDAPLGDTWVWDGEDWEELSPSGAPAARSRHALAGFDPS